MLLIAGNYPREIQKEFFENYDDVKVKFFRQKKGSLFVLQLQKYLLENDNIDMVVVLGTCGGQDENQLGQIYHTTRSFLWHNDHIIDSQKFRFNKYNFDSIPDGNIVTKFRVGQHTDKLYDFGSIYDIESFWIAQLSNQIGTPILMFKWVSDINQDVIFNKQDQIDFLLQPENKRQRKSVVYKKIKENIDQVNKNFQQFFENEFWEFYQKLKNNTKFRKKILY